MFVRDTLIVKAHISMITNLVKIKLPRGLITIIKVFGLVNFILRPTLLSLENLSTEQILLNVKAILSHLKCHFSDKRFRSLVGRLLFLFTVLFSSSTLLFFKFKTSTHSSESSDVEFCQSIRS